jgi:leukotriene-A4 hydrolase
MKHLKSLSRVQLVSFAMLMGVNMNVIASDSAILDPRHSYANPEAMLVTHTDLKLAIDFDRKVLKGSAQLTVKRIAGDILWLDAQGLKVSEIVGDDVVSWSAHKAGRFGEPLAIKTTKNKDTLTITIHYETSPTAPGLVWMNANQTRSGYPFMFAMNEPANFRTMAPGQDTPAVRGTFSADLSIEKSDQIKEPFMALIAGQNNPKTPNQEMVYKNLRSDVPIPSYLFVLAAGRFKYQSQGDRIGYYADTDKTLEDALVGFKNAPRYLEQLEKYLGDCKWHRQDFLFLPAMFGFGGMENPGLIYINEGLVEKTGASSYVIAHEFTHMKTGNEVTNNGWKGFWLNEGWTTYYEQRLLADIHGKDFGQGAEYEEYLELLAAEKERLAHANEPEHQPTRLHKINTKKLHPDDITEFSVYPKGANFLKNIEVIISREKFDIYARNYINHFSLKPIDAKMFVDFSTDELTKLHPGFDWNRFLKAWIYEPGLHPKPADIGLIKIYQPECTSCGEKMDEYKQYKAKTPFRTWNRFQIAHLLNTIKTNLDTDKKNLHDLELLLSCQSFTDTIAPNVDIRSLWYQTLVKGGLWHKKQDEIESYLTTFGRGRLIRPLYGELLSSKNSDSHQFAKKVFDANKDRYFNQVAGSIQRLFDKPTE